MPELQKRRNCLLARTGKEGIPVALLPPASGRCRLPSEPGDAALFFCEYLNATAFRRCCGSVDRDIDGYRALCAQKTAEWNRKAVADSVARRSTATDCILPLLRLWHRADAGYRASRQP